MSHLSVTEVSHAVFDSPQIEKSPYVLMAILASLIHLRLPFDRVNEIIGMIADGIGEWLEINVRPELDDCRPLFLLPQTSRELRTTFEHALEQKIQECPDFLDISDITPQP